MVSAVSQATSPAAESVPSDSTARHWLLGRYYVKTPDLSDETRWEISQGRAWPVFNGLMVLLHDLERRGTEQQQLAAVAGRIEHLGVNGLAESIRMSPTAILRQLRFLERIGIVRTTQATFTVETDPATGRIVRNYAKAPPKVIELTLTDRHYRPTGRAKAATGDTHETTARRQGDTHETTRTVRNPQGRNECVPRERTSKEVRSSGTNRRQDASGPLGRPETPAAKANPQSPHEPAWQRQAAEEERARNRQRQAEFMAAGLGIGVFEVIGLWRADPQGLKQRCVTAGIMTPEGGWIRRQRSLCSRATFHARKELASALSIHAEPQEARDAFGPAGDTSAREEAAAGLRDALAAMSPAGRERARDLGEGAEKIDEQIDQEADELLQIIEQRRTAAIEAQADSDRQCAELREEVERQERQFKELRQRLGVAKLRCES